jgi:hypothetical protein
MSARDPSSRFIPSVVGGLIAVSFLLTPAIAADRPLPVGPRVVPVPEDGALVGYGKGRLAMPTLSENGRLFGTLADPNGNELFQIDAMLTGCIPSAPAGTGPYSFGCIYGAVRKLVDADPLVQPRTILYEVEGTWILQGREGGSFSALAYDVLDSGRRVVAGKIYGEFALPPSGSFAITAPWGGAAPGKLKKVPFGDARHLTDPYRDAKRPTKGGGKVGLDDARTKRVTDPFRDDKSAHKGGGKTPVDDAAGNPGDPALGSFMLRYVFVR